MQYNEFIKSVKEHANLRTEEEALRAIAATFTTLAQRLAGREAQNLASQLPAEIQKYLENSGYMAGADFGINEFFQRVAKIENTDPNTAKQHAQAVMWTVSEASTRGELDNIRHQLPVEYSQLMQMTEMGLPDNAHQAKMEFENRY
ncbi:MAG TPA: DUF2267 domain-containing protein [Chloroflexia bacterium]|nr:DUF2267 domain-containing protein [Chloroflexia bacterium]